MAKAKAQITLSYIIDIKAYYRYYLLQSSTLTTPSVPTTLPPSGWGDTEPTYTSGSTNSLYFVDCTEFCDGTFSYSEVSLSSSYEAAKLAYNKAVNAQSSVDNMEIGGRNLLLNSSFTKNLTNWNNNGAEIVMIDDVECAHITGALNTTYLVYQSVFNKLDIEDLTQTYVFSADIRLDNYVAGTTNPYVKLYFSGNYDNNGTSTWLGATTVSGTQECKDYNNQGWVRIVWVVKFTKTPTNMGIYMYARDFTGDLYFKNLQLEKGNKASDWRPSPEDVESGIEDAKTNLESSIESLVARLELVEGATLKIDENLGSLVTGKDGASLMVQTDTGWQLNNYELENLASNTAQSLQALIEEYRATDMTVEELLNAINDIGLKTNYINPTTYKYTDESGVEHIEPCLEFGETDNDFKLLITNTQILFKVGSDTPTKINTSGMVTDNIIIENELRHTNSDVDGYYYWKLDGDGCIGLYWKGADA